MNDDRLLSIGGFALLTGPSVATLRHYDAEGVYQTRAIRRAGTSRAVRGPGHGGRTCEIDLIREGVGHPIILGVGPVRNRADAVGRS